MACQAESGALQLTLGAVLSMRTVWEFWAFRLPQLSVAWYTMVETPSFCRVMKATELLTVVWGRVSAPETE